MDTLVEILAVVDHNWIVVLVVVDKVEQDIPSVVEDKPVEDTQIVEGIQTVVWDKSVEGIQTVVEDKTVEDILFVVEDMVVEDSWHVEDILGDTTGEGTQAVVGDMPVVVLEFELFVV
jgi:hypothetical protein